MKFYVACRARDLMAFKDLIPFKITHRGSLRIPFVFSIESEVSLYKDKDYYFGCTNGFWFFPIENDTIYDTNFAGEKTSWRFEEGYIIGCKESINGPIEVNLRLLTDKMRSHVENGILQDVKLKNPVFTGGNVRLIADTKGCPWGVLTGKGMVCY